MKPVERIKQETLATKIVIGEIVDIAIEHKKKFAILVIAELYIHSLVFQHLKELKDLLDLIPFYHIH